LGTVRYLLPLLIFLGGAAVLLFSTDSGRLDIFFMAAGAALSVFFLNWLFRLGAEGDREREKEEAARQYFAEHGHWPDER
jgi:hypothetical protein